MSLTSGSPDNTHPVSVEKSHSRKVLGATSLAHLFHDGATDLHYVLFAIWQQQFGLSMAQIGLLKMLFSGAMSAFQIPAGELGRKYGERKVLMAGTLLLTVALLLYGTSSTLIQLMVLIVIGGLAPAFSIPYHPVLLRNIIPRSRPVLRLAHITSLAMSAKG